MRWSRREICFVACRILVLIFLVFAVDVFIDLSSALSETLQNGTLVRLGWSSLSLFLTLLPIFLIWFFSGPLSRWMAGKNPANQEAPRESVQDELLRIPETKDLLHVGITVVGLVTFTNGIYHSLVEIGRFAAIKLKPLPEFRESLTGEAKATVLASTLLILIGAGLVFFGRSLSGLLAPGDEERPKEKELDVTENAP